jgi:hypothetical protein
MSDEMRERAGNVLATGCMLSIMAIIYTSLGFCIGWVLGRM